MKYLSIIIPVYNESSNLREDFPEFIKWINKYIQSRSHLQDKIEIIFSEDGSTDHTLDILNEIKGEISCPVKILHSKRRLGKGGGFKKGFMEARGKYVILYDCDLSVSPDQIENLITEIEKGYDIVIGSRKLKQSRWLNSPPVFRHLLGLVLGILGRSGIIFHVPFLDTQCGFKIFSKVTTKYYVKDLMIKGWIFDFEIVLRAYYSNLKIKEIPVVYKFKKDSKIKLPGDPIKIFYDLTRLRLKHLKFFFFSPGRHKKKKQRV